MEKYEFYIVFISYTIWRTLRPPVFPHAWPGMGNGGVPRVRQGNTSPANITTVVEMQSKPLPLSPVCPIRLPFILFSILSFIILWVNSCFNFGRWLVHVFLYGSGSNFSFLWIQIVKFFKI